MSCPEKAVEILLSAVEECKKRTPKDVEFLLIICNDIARVANKRGWLDDYKARISGK
jgi:hypothetical protein